MGRPTADIIHYPTNCRINGMLVGVARLWEIWFMAFMRFWRLSRRPPALGMPAAGHAPGHLRN